MTMSGYSWMFMFLTYFLTYWTVSHAFNLTILHTNDVHSRIQETNKYSGPCSESDSQKGKCFGGVARIRTMVKMKRQQYPEQTLLLSAGDEYQGTLWFYKFGGALTARFMNLIGYDAMALGNHEFDRGVEGLKPLVEIVKFPILSSNADFSKAQTLQQKIQKSTVVQVGTEKVGIVGYTTRETSYISNPGVVTFSQEQAAVQAEIDKLKGQGINKIIALGHVGFRTDLGLARNLSGVDVIVGGHTNTFLYTGDTPPSNEKPADTYPVVVENQHGERVLVVQDYAYGKYLGELHVTFDAEGRVTSSSGNPILLDNSVARDSETLGIIQSYLPELDALKQDVIGKSHVRLEQANSVCRIRECNLGNLVADAMLRQNLRHSVSLYWSDVAIAVMNSGGLRAPLEPGNITVEDAAYVQPFRNTVDIVVLTGETVKAMLEFGATRWKNDTEDAFGGFFQVSGLQIVYDMDKPAGQRVVRVLARCHECLVPKFEPLDMNKTYPILMNSFIANGGDGYSIITKNIIRKHIIGDVDIDILIEYIKGYSPIIHGLEGRLQFEGENIYGFACDQPARASGRGGAAQCSTFDLRLGVVMLLLARVLYTFHL